MSSPELFELVKTYQVHILSELNLRRKLSKRSLHMYAENKPPMKSNEAVLNNLPGELYTIEANNKTPGNYKYPLATIQAAQNQKQKNAGGVCLKLVCFKVT